MNEDARHALAVARKAVEAHNMASLERGAPEGWDLPAFSAGAQTDVSVPGGDGLPYSPFNSEGERLHRRARLAAGTARAARGQPAQ